MGESGWKLLALVAATTLLLSHPASAISLEEAYDRAGPAHGYDRYVVLETGVTYTGALWIGATFNRITAEFDGAGEDVRIVGNGAILDLRGGEITVAYTNRRLDIDDCVILDGNVRFRGYTDGVASLLPRGSVRHVTFYRPHDYGVRAFHCGEGILIERNLVVDPVDTGPDFMFLSGEPSDWLPTGTSVAQSLTLAGGGVIENWSYHSDPVANADPVRHFSMLCDFG